MSVINISGYKFVKLEKIASLKVELRKCCLNSGLKGTILLSEEGININLAGARAAVDAFRHYLQADARFADISLKESLSETLPFSRMLIKLRKEIITMGVAGMRPPSRPDHALEPTELKDWLDQGKPVTLLDTRNDYEYKIGSFKNSKKLAIKSFRDFPAAMEQFSAEEKKQVIVMFCTGGVRCEKAMPFLKAQGFEQIFQLHGGILKYFEECGEEHWEGECFVFDDRIALNPQLQETGSKLCRQCQMPVTLAEQRQFDFATEQRCGVCRAGASFP